MGATKEKFAICDWNGTLLNDLSLAYGSVISIFHAHGLVPPALRHYREEMTHEWTKFYLKHGIPLGPSIEDFCDRLNKIRREYFEAHWNQVFLHEGTMELFKVFKELHVRAFLVTGEVPEVVQNRLKQFDLEGCFEDVWAGVQHKAEIISMLPVHDGKCIYLDDDPTGIEAAKSFGITTIGVTHGYASSRRIKSSKPDLVADTMHEIIPFVRNIFAE